MLFLYNITIHTYYLLISIASIFSEKARLWKEGRKNIFEKLYQKISRSDKIAWFHVASLGEFEQGRPVIEAFKKAYPNYKIFLTFFSPSGFRIRKNYEGADNIFYLPFDSPKNARKLLSIVKPKLAIFVKYEFWYNYLINLEKEKVPVFYISTIFRKEQYFFKWYGSWFRKHLRNINYFFVQNKESLSLLNSIGIKNAVISGDTRFDRVYAIKESVKTFSLIEKFITGKKVFLAGSTWEPCEEIMKNLIKKTGDEIKYIIAPHETNNNRISSVIKNLENYNVLRYSKANDQNILEAEVLIIDSIGILSNLYQYCDMAYIGGGFGKGIHNIQEVITFGKPVIFGPNYHKFKEANELIKLGGAYNINNSHELIDIVGKLFQEKELYNQSSEVCTKYVEDNIGATEIILSKINEFITS